jgi:CheY-like chemotaxis protein
MPEKGGVEATVDIREFDFTTPIIAFTANALEEDMKKFFTVGMVTYPSLVFSHIPE